VLLAIRPILQVFGSMHVASDKGKSQSPMQMAAIASTKSRAFGWLTGLQSWVDDYGL